MRVLVRLFGSYRGAAGVGSMDLELPAQATVRDAVAAIVQAHPLLARGPRLVIARNREYVADDETLNAGDEVALIPPVSGGATRSGLEAAVLVTPDPLSVDAVLEQVRDAAVGGIVVFLGTVRDRSGGRSVSHLEYEAYTDMAEAKMREIAARLERGHSPLRVVMHHRTGDLAIGETAVIVAAAAPHRDAAFAAARAAIDELKTIVPIWKKEFTEDGSIWIEPHA
ncbi:MAG: molybdenum cofactor biosynthesis protein MoaE [Chloroflexota bacterium]|nr:molybdenum cofactor biosynthesis protein MoaE [Chloroflexota bacterium]